jgi:RNA-directed DNA polymerase
MRGSPGNPGALGRSWQRLVEELAKLDVQLNHDKTRRLDLSPGETFGFPGFDFRRAKTRPAESGARVTRHG